MTEPNLWALAWTQLWQITLLVVVVGACTRTVLRRRPHVVYLLWAVVFVKCLTPPLWSSPTGVFSWLTLQQDDFAEVVMPPELRHELALGEPPPPPKPGPMIGAPVERLLSVDDPQSGAELPGPWQPASKLQPDWGRLFAVFGAIWFGGVVLLVALAACRWWDIYREVQSTTEVVDKKLSDLLQRLATKLGVRRRVRMVVTSSNFGPTAFGLYRPVVILPRIMVEGVSLSKLEPIIAHELVHLRRGDTVLGAIQFAAQICWWFHPLVWWAGRESNRVCEQCCDEQAVAGLRCRPASYAAALIDVLELKSRLRTGLPMPGVRPADVTTSRVQHIMFNAKRFHARTPALYWIAAAVLSLAVLPGEQMHFSVPNKADTAIDWRTEIRQAMSSGDFATAESHLRKVLDVYPKDEVLWLRLGVALHGRQRYDEALEAYEHALDSHRTRAVASYNTACAHALQGNDEGALHWLERAVELGFFAPERTIDQDPDFATLKDNPQFQELKQRALPPYRLEEPHQLDFLVGHWDVYTEDGRRLGISRFEKGDDSSLVAGYWTDCEGQGGISLSCFDPDLGKWRRMWLDESGATMTSTGGFENCKWCMQGELSRADGTRMRTRLLLEPQPNGNVIRSTEDSYDGGTTWERRERLVYVRLPAESTPPETTTVSHSKPGFPITNRMLQAALPSA